MSHAKVAVSIHRASDGPDTARVASRGWIPYSDNAVAFAAAAVALVALAVYLRTMLPSTFFWDTGEAQTVPATLSIFHPTGFPVYALIGWLWSQLPIGEVAWRMNLLSAICVALAAGLVVLIAGHLIEESNRFLRAGAAGVAGLAFAFAAEPWENATRADVHALNVVFVALVVWLLISWAAAYRSGSRRADRWLVAAALAFGLGIGAHPLVGLTAFGVAAWLLFIHARLWRRWRLVALCAAMVAIGHRQLRLHLPSRDHRSGARPLLRAPRHLGAIPVPRLRRAVPRPVHRLRLAAGRLLDEVGRDRAGPGRAVPARGLAADRGRRGDPGGEATRGVRVPRADRRRHRPVRDELPRRRHRPLLPADDRRHRTADRSRPGVHREHGRPRRRRGQPALRGQPQDPSVAGHRGGGHDRRARCGAAGHGGS